MTGRTSGTSIVDFQAGAGPLVRDPDEYGRPLSRQPMTLAAAPHHRHCVPAWQAGAADSVRRSGSEAVMVQTTNRFFDDVARLMNDAAGVAQGVRREFETLFRSQAERILRDLDVVQREEFEAVKDMARLARE
jgi:BMFP domain-containing protein YqiC